MVGQLDERMDEQWAGRLVVKMDGKLDETRAGRRGRWWVGQMGARKGVWTGSRKELRRDWSRAGRRGKWWAGQMAESSALWRAMLKDESLVIKWVEQMADLMGVMKGGQMAGWRAGWSALSRGKSSEGCLAEWMARQSADQLGLWEDLMASK